MTIETVNRIRVEETTETVALDCTGLRVDSFAWVAHSRRGKALSKAPSRTEALAELDALRTQVA